MAPGQPVPLSVLDLTPISSGDDVAGAVGKTIDLARHAEAAGYARYWLAEHHLSPGVAGANPALLIALVAAATARIRVGSGAVQMGHRTALSVVEEFGLLAALHPGRIDLGVGRTPARSKRRPEPALAGTPGGPADPAPQPAPQPAPPRSARHTANGLLLPAPFPVAALLASPRFALQGALLRQPNAEPQGYAEQIDDMLALFEGDYRSPDGVDVHATPGEGADLQVWVLGSSAGESAEAAGARGLPFGANYHVSPGSVVEAVEAYRAAFRPSRYLSQPRVLVSADVVVAAADATARELASPYPLWVRSIRAGEGAIPFPTPAEAAAHVWTAADRALVVDRVDTQFVGAPDTVVERLRVLQEATGADELLITTITHDHADRVRSYQLLARAWGTR
jgi:alkanesulfonate monooxygenase SsuD/methylene tetrahydromethanopterin reductase-like flavin-dependent oxidoreductase (luciferase family)